jgi:hypothetical protein
MAGFALLKHMYDLSDEALCDRWIENPYYQFFWGRRSSSIGCRITLVADLLATTQGRSEDCGAHPGEPRGCHPHRGDEAQRPRSHHRRHDGTAEGVMFPTDAKLLNRAREYLVRLAGRVDVELRRGR